MCGFLGKISNSPISLERLNKANIQKIRPDIIIDYLKKSSLTKED